MSQSGQLPLWVEYCASPGEFPDPPRRPREEMTVA